jgi:oligopeptide/dipeptide ABC transporter ATP-binding protein
MLDIRDLRLTFHDHGVDNEVLHGINLHMDAGERLGLVGESGSGKSVTALAVAGLLRRSSATLSGEILFEGRDLLKLPREEMRKIQGREIGMIFQEPMTSLNPVYTAGKQVTEAILLHQHVPREEAKRMTLEIFREVGIPEPEKRYGNYPHQLSGGLRQRVMIGMAMVCKPRLMIADEPTTALDVTIEAQILHLMRRLRDETGTSIMLITHNLGVVAEICDYVYVMYAGRVMESAPIGELFENPSHPYTFGLLNSIPKITETKERLYTIRGMVPNLQQLPKGCRFCPRCDKVMRVCTERQPDLIDIGNGHRVRCHLYDKEVTGE